MATEVERLLVTLEARMAGYQRDLAKAQAVTNTQLGAIEKRFATMSASIRTSTSTAAMGVSGALGSLGAALGAAQVLTYANSWTRLTRSLEASQQIFGVSLRNAEDLNALANEARVGVEAYSKLYIRASAALRDYGFAAGTAETVTSSLSKALKLGGADASEQASVLLQFSQALQKGKLDGDEFRTVMENAGVVQELLAKRLKVTKGDIINLAAAGKLQIPDLVGAMVDGADQIDRIYRQMPQTVDEAFTVLQNNLTQFLGQADKATGASAALADGIVTVSQNLEAMSVVAGAILGSAALRMASFAAATVAVSNPLTLIAGAIGALAVGFGVYGDKINVADEGSVSLKSATIALFETLGDTDAVKTVSSLMGSLSESIRTYAADFATWAGSAGAAIANVLGLSDDIDRVIDRARDIEIRRGIERKDFGKIIRDARDGKLVTPTKGKASSAIADKDARRTVFEREVDQIKQRTAALKAEASTIQETTLAQEKARAAAELRAAAMQTAAREGRAVTDAETKAIERLSAAYADAQVQARFLQQVQSLRDDNLALENEIALTGLWGAELTKARIEQQLLTEAKLAGIEVTEAQRAEISRLAETNALLNQQREILDEVRSTSQDALKTFISDMREGVSATEALGNQLDKLAGTLLEMAADSLVESALGPLKGLGGSGPVGGGGLLSLLGFAGGGVMVPGRGAMPLKRFARGGVSKRAAIFGEAGPEAAVPLPDGRRIPVDLKMGPAAGAGGAVNVTVAPVFNVQNGTPEGVDKLRRDVAPQIQKLVRQEVGQIFDRQRRFTRSGL